MKKWIIIYFIFFVSSCSGDVCSTNRLLLNVSSRDDDFVARTIFFKINEVQNMLTNLNAELTFINRTSIDTLLGVYFSNTKPETSEYPSNHNEIEFPEQIDGIGAKIIIINVHQLYTSGAETEKFLEIPIESKEFYLTFLKKENVLLGYSIAIEPTCCEKSKYFIEPSCLDEMSITAENFY